ncbi:MBL fold metallo-hydrolase [Janibacter sp. G56]|uniref:MBL fold metallo-hydrolase n=1 Tax=Janibacter sp. G56 TaxID=3418717 RepID=UPI003D079F62
MRIPGLAVAAGTVGVAAWMVRAGRPVPEAIGGRPSGARLDRSRESEAWSEGRFRNQRVRHEPAGRTAAGTAKQLVVGRGLRHPSGDVPIIRGPIAHAPDGTHVTWLGHSSVLVQVDGVGVLIDPVWSDRCSPSQQVGPRRWHPVPCAIDELPTVHAVVISHDHYDHLDMHSIKELAARDAQTRFVVPLGVGAHLEKWGVESARIDELDWHEEVAVAGVRLVATPAQHFSGRGLVRDATLWASWVIAGPTTRVFYSGDTGYCDAFAEIGERHGPFDATLIQVGAYDAGWPLVHMTPEQGINTHEDVRGGLLVPLHWATFNLAFHPWSEPVERLVTEAARRGVSTHVPRPGERIDVAAPPTERSPWWRALG